MLTPEIVAKLAKKYHLQIGLPVTVSDGRVGRLINVRFEPDVGIVQFLGVDNVFFKEKFGLDEIQQPSIDWIGNLREIRMKTTTIEGGKVKIEFLDKHGRIFRQAEAENGRIIDI